MQKVKRQAFCGLITASILLCLVTVFASKWYEQFSQLPLRIMAILSIQVIIAMICHCMLEKQSLCSIGFSGQKPLSQLGWAITLFSGISILFIVLPVLFGQSLNTMLPRKDMLWFAIPYKLIFVGFSEELLFRGYFLNSLQRLTNSKIAAVVSSSLLFGLWHFILSGNILQVIFTGIIGGILALPRMYKKRCSIVSVSLAHGLYDTLLSTLSWIV